MALGDVDWVLESDKVSRSLAAGDLPDAVDRAGQADGCFWSTETNRQHGQSLDPYRCPQPVPELVVQFQRLGDGPARPFVLPAPQGEGSQLPGGHGDAPQISRVEECRAGLLD